MFSGLIRQFARVRNYRNNILCLESPLFPSLGDSIAINGACLTAIETQKDYFCVEISKETAQSIAIENLIGLVHIEPALQFSDGLHGHIVQGHIDSIGLIIKKETISNQTIFHVQADSKTLELMINKGSVCVDGVSLTINYVCDKYFELVVIPHTMQTTLFHAYQTGRRVNIETDIIVRSLFSLMQKHIANKQHNNITQAIFDSITLGY
ncbi:riboflavin synthase [Helicobacter aurati]|uniref:Riboflavin synthase n=1 Tax=Helicobacter aurati TaxID=137778 RepID=A0A3D8J784_9HELI|nr:riboflavin synthase [Helicobacter aurati]RDU73140.1 riboflavin synthase [Helicobacter aurati]